MGGFEKSGPFFFVAEINLSWDQFLNSSTGSLFRNYIAINAIQFPMKVETSQSAAGTYSLVLSKERNNTDNSIYLKVAGLCFLANKHHT